MPKTKLQNIILTLIMAFVMVYAMVCYNIALEKGAELPHGAVLADLFRRPRSAECLWVCCREKWQKTRKMRNSVRNKTDY